MKTLIYLLIMFSNLCLFGQANTSVPGYNGMTETITNFQNIQEPIAITSALKKNSIKTKTAEKKYYLFWYEVGGALWFYPPQHTLEEWQYTQYHSLSYQYHKNYFISFQYSISIKKISEFSGLFGIRTYARFGSISISAGVGSFKGHYANKDFFTMGFPINAKVFFTPLKFIGIGLCLIGNVNLERSYAGFGLNLQIGRLM